MSGGGDEPAADGLWAAVRQRYEDGREAVSAIAKEAGLTAQALTHRARAEGWRLRAGRTPQKKTMAGAGETIGRLKTLLQQRLADFEGQMGTLSAEASAATTERDIRALNGLVRTLEKVLELERKERSRKKQQRDTTRQFDDAERDALADKIEGLHRELALARGAAAAVEGEPDPRGEASQP